MSKDGAARGTVERIDRALDLLARGIAAIGTAAVAGIFGLVLTAVVMRYAVSAPFRFTEELAGLFLVSSVFLTLPLTLTARSNVRVTVLSDRLTGPWRRLAWIAGQGVLVAFGAVFAWEAWRMLSLTTRLNLMSEAARLPLWPFVAAMTASAALVAAIGAWQAFRPPPPPRSPG
jgi:TRAP-type C4-dicarboxylate transport system permease small subunit